MALASASFSAVTARRWASASSSRRVASDFATLALEVFSPSTAEALAAATEIRWSRTAFASPMEPSRFRSATEIRASLIALAAASLPRASMYPDSSLMSVTLTLISRRPILRSSLSTLEETAARNLSRSILISSISIVAMIRRIWPKMMSLASSWIS